jgi:hypothetical protein
MGLSRFVRHFSLDTVATPMADARRRRPRRQLTDEFKSGVGLVSTTVRRSAAWLGEAKAQLLDFFECSICQGRDTGGLRQISSAEFDDAQTKRCGFNANRPECWFAQAPHPSSFSLKAQRTTNTTAQVTAPRPPVSLDVPGVSTPAGAAVPSALSEPTWTQGLSFHPPTDDGTPFQSDLDGQPEVYPAVDTRLADLGGCLRKAIEGARYV